MNEAETRAELIDSALQAAGWACPDEEFVQLIAAQIPWFHNCLITYSVSRPTEVQI